MTSPIPTPQWCIFTGPLVFSRASKPRTAAATRSARAIEQLTSFRSRGGKVLWTIHEPLPHDCAFPEVETNFRRELAALVDAVHIMHPSTVDVVRPIFAIDDVEQVVVPIPSYEGVYPNYVSRDEARARLGITDEFVLVAFGAIRPYKQFDQAIDAVDVLSAQGVKARLIIAGPSYASVDNSELIERADANELVQIHPHAVPDDEVQYLFKAADLVVLPYTDFLNSAVLVLAKAFDVPAVVPENAATAERAALGGVHLYGGARSFTDAVSEAAGGAPPSTRSTDDDPLPTLVESLVALGWTTSL